jgi:hypothetical protein
MECFYHEGRTAVGSCRACLRGLCRACAADLDRGLACRNRCETHARNLIAALDQSSRYPGALKAARGLWVGIGFTAFFVGGFVVIWSLSLPRYREIALLGVPFLIIAVLAIRASRASRAPESPSSVSEAVSR